MSISVYLRNEQGETVSRLSIPYVPTERSWDEPSTPLLAGVDLYGNAIFNAKQMLQMQREISTLLNGELTDEERGSLTAVLELCSEGQRPPHRYLWFVGD